MACGQSGRSGQYVTDITEDNVVTSVTILSLSVVAVTAMVTS